MTEARELNKVTLRLLEETGLGLTPVWFSTSKPVLTGDLLIPFLVDEGRLVLSITPFHT